MCVCVGLLHLPQPARLLQTAAEAGQLGQGHVQLSAGLQQTLQLTHTLRRQRGAQHRLTVLLEVLDPVQQLLSKTNSTCVK